MVLSYCPLCFSLWDHYTSTTHGLSSLFTCYFAFIFAQSSLWVCWTHSEGPVYHTQTGSVKLSQGELFIICTAAGVISVFFSGVWAIWRRYLANLYHTKLYSFIYLPLRDLSGDLWWVVVSSLRYIKDLLCRIRVYLPLYLFISLFFVFMVSWVYRWQFSVTYCLRSSDILRVDTYTCSRLICTLLRQVFR